MEPKAAESGAGDLSQNRLVSFILWRVPWIFIAAGIIWPAPRGALWTLALAWIGAGCLTNALRCGRVHCTVMGPGFLFLSLVSLARTVGLISLHWNLVWGAAVAIVAIAYLPEFFGKKYLRQRPAC
jgi:hypothetical protein